MRRHRRPLAALALLLALALPLPAAAALVPASGDGSASPTFDTPQPTPAPDVEPGRTARPDTGPDDTPAPTPAPTPRPTKTPKPIATYAQNPAKVALAPASTEIAVGLPENSKSQAPLRWALKAGYFKDAGFTEVDLDDETAGLADLQGGELQFAVLDAIEAADAFAEDPSLQAIAGYQNYRDGEYGGTVLAAAPGLVAEEPSTVAAFTKAYILGLRDVAKAAGKDPKPEVAAFWPFDGGFGSRAEEDGWGQLSEYLADETDPDIDVQAFVSEHTLNVGQVSLDIAPNPAGGLSGNPATTKITVGRPGDGPSPLVFAKEQGYFKKAGFKDVDIKDVEQPLLGVLQGELDFAVIDKLDAVDGASQGLPLVAVAGHQNYDADDVYGGDLIAVSRGFFDEQGPAVAAFVTAYVRALREIEGSAEVGIFGPFDGGFGSRDEGAGLGELRELAADALGEDVDLGALIDPTALQRAQTWWGLPANPASTAQDAAESGSEEE